MKFMIMIQWKIPEEKQPKRASQVGANFEVNCF